MRLKLFFSVIFLSLWNFSAYAEDYECPNIIGTPEAGVFVQDTVSIVKNIYQNLGCETQFLNLPIKRGTTMFNEGFLDGEALRTPAFEKSFTAPFVKSDIPLMEVKSSIWENPNIPKSQDKRIGYLLGVKWQETYVNNKNAHSFSTAEALFKAFREGRIRCIIAVDYTINKLHKKKPFTFQPTRGKELKSIKLHHYTHQKYAPFMDAFSNYLKEKVPFKDMVAVGNM